MTRWRGDPVFDYLADEFANDNVVFLTGAGISLDLRDKHGKSLPSWLELLQQLKSSADKAGLLALEDSAELDTLLTGTPNPTSVHYLEAATILSQAVGSDFPNQISDATRSAADATTDLHRAIHRCAPRAIITFNYDEGHEAAARELNPGDPAWNLILPADPEIARSEEYIRAALAPGGMRRQLVKAHGSVVEPRSLVLTRETYREVLARRPAYRALLTQIFVNFTVVAIGFGMDDPDFQFTLDMLERDVGGRLRRHVYLTRRRLPKAPASSPDDMAAARQEIIMRRRFGFEPLFCDEWHELPAMLQDLTSLAGPHLRSTVDASIDPMNEKRGAAHHIMSRLSENGAQRAVALIDARLAVETNDWRRAEWCYSLGRIRPKLPQAKAALKACIIQRHGIRSIATAVIGFVEYADASDIPWLKEQLALWNRTPHPQAGTLEDPEDRVTAYLQYAIQKTSAKHAAWNAPL